MGCRGEKQGGNTPTPLHPQAMGVRTMKSFVMMLIALAVCALLAGSFGGGDAKPDPTPAPASAGAAAAVAIMDGIQPLVVSSAGAVDTLSKMAYDPQPTFYETWGATLTAICLVGLVLGTTTLVVVLWFFARAGLFTALVSALAGDEETAGDPGAGPQPDGPGRDPSGRAVKYEV